MKLTVKDINGRGQGELEVKFPLIADGKGTQAVHERSGCLSANQRMGTACTKTMGEVAGTGQETVATEGHWSGAGRFVPIAVVARRRRRVRPKPRDFGKKVSKATKQLALRKALSERLKSGDVVVVEDIKLSSPKPKSSWALLGALAVEGTALVSRLPGTRTLRWRRATCRRSSWPRAIR